MKVKRPSIIKPLAMIVDDDRSIRLTMSAVLAKADFEVIEAENGRMALPLFESRKPDIVLLDVDMPEMNGYETCTAIRQLPGGEHVQVIMVTGMDDSESAKRAFEAGANDIMAKPINWVMLGHRSKNLYKASQAFIEAQEQKSFAADIIQAYLEAADRVVNDLREAYTAQDADRLLRAAHSLKSSSANIGALTLAE